MANNNPQRSRAPKSRCVLFLDFDDVVVLNEVFGGYDVALALTTAAADSNLASEPTNDLWKLLMSSSAVELLRNIHAEFVPEYVLSTSWSRVMDDSALIHTLHRSGLQFVADHLHTDMTTFQARPQNCRWDEIERWLVAHPEYAERWVVLDDLLSGTGLVVPEADARWPFIVLCTKDVGLTEGEYRSLREAFLRRAEQDAK